MSLLLITVKEHRYQQVKCSSVSVTLTCVKKKYNNTKTSDTKNHSIETIWLTLYYYIQYTSNNTVIYGVVSLIQHSIFYIGTGKKKMLAM